VGPARRGTGLEPRLASGVWGPRRAARFLLPLHPFVYLALIVVEVYSENAVRKARSKSTAYKRHQSKIKARGLTILISYALYV
jgi:hypothetical protein